MYEKEMKFCRAAEEIAPVPASAVPLQLLLALYQTRVINKSSVASN
jgi:hypothetical protein